MATNPEKEDEVTAVAGDLAKVTIDGNESDVFSTLTPEQQCVVDKLRKLQAEQQVLMNQYENEVSQLKVKYEALYTPLYLQRSDILTSETLTDGPKTTGTPALPNFWVRALERNAQIGSLVGPQDGALLSFLEDVKVAPYPYLPEDALPAGYDRSKIHMDTFTLTFVFAKECEAFKPHILHKTYVMSLPSDPSDGDNPHSGVAMLVDICSTPIEWSTGQNPTLRVVQRKQRSRKTKATRTVTETIENLSFFKFFQSQHIPEEEELRKMTPEDEHDLEQSVEQDYDNGLVIKEKILPRAIRWFLDEISDDDDFYGSDDDLDDDIDDDETDYGDDDDPVPSAGRKKRW